MKSFAPEESSPPACAGERADIHVEVVTAADLAWLDQQLADPHYLGAGHPVGDYPRQVVRVRGRLAACWCGARPVMRSRIAIVGWAGTPPNAWSG